MSDLERCMFALQQLGPTQAINALMNAVAVLMLALVVRWLKQVRDESRHNNQRGPK